LPPNRDSRKGLMDFIVEIDEALSILISHQTGGGLWDEKESLLLCIGKIVFGLFGDLHDRLLICC
jgi:hypothetical protein